MNTILETSTVAGRWLGARNLGTDHRRASGPLLKTTATAIKAFYNEKRMMHHHLPSEEPPYALHIDSKRSLRHEICRYIKLVGGAK